MRYEAAIGLEVHVQLRTATKLFCRCENRFGAEANTLVCGVCLGYPGTLPVVNREAIDLAVRLALALGCRVSRRSVFARKNYFYADLPKGYQISQYDEPLAVDGALPLSDSDRVIRIERLHLEEDAGKLLHELPGGAPLPGESLVDFNRCGVPLVEIVSGPELRTAAEAQDYLQTLHRVLRYTATSDGNMEEGSLRCDANVSIRPEGAPELGTKTEVKNLNSFRNVARAVEYEIDRQSHLIDHGERVVQETRTFDAAAGRTRAMRSKEEAHDYRYFPDPDLPAVILGPRRIEDQRADLPELPWQRRSRFVEQYALSDADARLLSADVELADYFEAAVDGRSARAKPIANWVMTEVLRLRKLDSARPAEQLAPERLAELVGMVEEGELSGSAAKEVFAAVWGSAETPRAAMQRLGLGMVRGDDQLERWVDEVIATHPGPADEYRSGKEKVLGFLVGQVMRLSSGRAEPARVRQLLAERLVATAGSTGETP